jgi:RNA polymerase sigma-70 factor (ECF subfamily)
VRLGPDGSLSIVDGRKVVVAVPADARRARFTDLVGGALDGAYRRAAVLLGDRFEAEDAVHDAAERAWRAWSSLRETDRFDAWFARIVLNVCRDRLRRRRRIARVEVRNAVDDVDAVAAASLAGVGERLRMHDALAVLTADERIAIVLRYEADLTVPEVARLAGAPEGTIKARLHRAHAKLRLALEDRPG